VSVIFCLFLLRCACKKQAKNARHQAVSDKNYIIFARIHPRGSTNPRIFSIYISFLNKENKWSEPLELGEKFNMDGNQPRISPDGKFIFFVGNDGMSYWVSSKIIDEIKTKN
jgi:hypothetical protein